MKATASTSKNLARLQLDSAVVRMTRAIHHGVPKHLRTVMYDIRRGRRNPFAQPAAIVLGCVDDGAPLADALAPLMEIQQEAIARVAPRVTLHEARMEETQANQAADLAQIEYEHCPCHGHRMALLETMARQRVATDLVTAVLVREDGR